MPIEEDASIDVRHLRELLSKIPVQDPQQQQPAQTLVPRSPPPQPPPPAPPTTSTPTTSTEDRVPASPTILSSLPYHTPNTHETPAGHEQPTSHDQSGSLHLAYSIPFSQIDLGETQVDSSSLRAVRINNTHSAKNSQEDGQSQLAGEKSSPPHAHEMIEISSEPPPATAPEPEPEPDDDMLLDDDCAERSAYFPEASRFNSPGYQSSPVKLGHNPLAHLGGMDAGTGFSLSQVFNMPSSPVQRTRTLDSQPPPTPRSAARMMARSMPLAATIWEDGSSPAARMRGTTEPPEFLKEYREQSPTKQKSNDLKTARARSKSPVVSSSPPPRPLRAKSVQVIESDSDDSLFSDSEYRKRRAQEARNHGAEQLKKWTTVGDATKKAAKKATRKPKKRSKALERSVKSNVKTQPAIQIPDDDETGDETGESQNVANQKPNQSTDDVTSQPPPPPPPPVTTQVHQTQVPASPPKELLQPNIDLDETWEQLHGPQLSRRAKSYSNLRSQAPSASLRHTHSMPAPPTLEKLGTSANPASLKHMVPFNIPAQPLTPPERTEESTDPPRDGPEYVRESSGLLPPTSQAPTPNPSSPTRDARGSSPLATTAPNAKGAPEIQPANEEIQNGALTASRPERDIDMSASEPPAPSPPVETAGEIGSPNKRRRDADDGNGGDSTNSVSDEPTKAQSELKSFAALDNSQLPLSSQEDADEVDMIDIVQSVGVGNRPDLEMPALSTPTPKGRSNKRRKTSKGHGVPVPVVEIEKAPPAPPKEPETPIFAPPPPPPPRSTAKSSRVDLKAKGKLAKAARTSISSAKTPVSKAEPKTRNASQQRRTSTAMADSPMAETEDENDILTSNNPAVVISMQSSTPLVAPHRVFALFKDSKLQYHPATVIPTKTQHQVRVAFDDGTEDVLEPHCVRSLDLRLGDVIKVDLPHMKKSTYIIKGFPAAPTPPTGADPVTPVKKTEDTFTDIRGHSIVSISPKNADANTTPEEVPVTSIYLIKSLWSQFAARDTSSKSITFPLSSAPSLRRTVSPSYAATQSFSIRRTSTPATASTTNLTPVSRGSGIFNNMIFTLSFGGENDTLKRSTQAKILSSGGRILDSGFQELFQDFDPDSPATPLRFLPSTQNLGFAAVIAHSHSRRPKYLQALALGLPCLSGRWIEDCVKKGKVLDWEYYLLPAGESKFLNGAVRSRVLPVFCADTAKVVEVVEKRRRVLGGRKKAFTFLALAQGAEKVVAVKTLEAAEKVLDDGDGWDCVLVAEKERWKHKGLRVIDDDDLVQSLILGRFLE
ncbi:hypothetical protein K440DRAFT_646099 [Wilcoxina mikolae CBS 423.85]|nr:hypothetical protein K440DRAFT_646099 [Wilcoxina mikolae CBS 423.85]